METRRSCFLILCGLMMMPPSLHATPENTFNNSFNPGFAADMEMLRQLPVRTVKEITSHQFLFEKADDDFNIERFLQPVFQYINKELGFSEQAFSLKPMLGLDIAQRFTLAPDVTLTPEIYALYRYEAMVEDDDSPLFFHHAMQAGMGVTLKMADSFSAHASFETDLPHDHRAILTLKYHW